MHPITGWLPILTRAKQMKSLERNERITLRQVTRIYHWFRSIQLYFIISKLISSVHVIYEKCVISIFQIWICDEMRDSHNVSKIGLIFSALSKLACGGLVRQVRHLVQPWYLLWWWNRAYRFWLFNLILTLKVNVNCCLQPADTYMWEDAILFLCHPVSVPVLACPIKSIFWTK